MPERAAASPAVGAGTVGPGRLLAAAPDARVLCVYLRGERQARMSDLPARGQRFALAWAEVEPKSEAAGLRRSLELTGQVLAKLAELEERTLGSAAAAEEPR